VVPDRSGAPALVMRRDLQRQWWLAGEQFFPTMTGKS
jgi:hypothetical protein